MQVLVQLKRSPQMFVSTSYVGEMTKDEDGFIELSKVCVVHEMLFQSKEGQVDIRMTFYTSNLLSNGSVRFQYENINLTRELADDDDLLKGCNESHEAFRVSKAGLIGMRPAPKGN